MPVNVNCPHCRTLLEWNTDNPHRPFCSKKCQLIDLGEWADEQKSIPCGANKDSELNGLTDVEDIEAILAEAEKQQDFFKH